MAIFSKQKYRNKNNQQIEINTIPENLICQFCRSARLGLV
jgi:hypothetical protein